MKTISPFLAALILVFSTAVQANAQAPCTGLYQCSLMAYAEAKAELDGPGKGIVVLENNVMRDPPFMKILPSNMHSSTVEYLAVKAIKQRCQRTGKQVPVVEVQPVEEHKGLLIVRCAEFGAYIRRGKLVLGVYGGYEVHWRFDCARNEFLKTKVQRYPAYVM